MGDSLSHLDDLLVINNRLVWKYVMRTEPIHIKKSV